MPKKQATIVFLFICVLNTYAIKTTDTEELFHNVSNNLEPIDKALQEATFKTNSQAILKVLLKEVELYNTILDQNNFPDFKVPIIVKPLDNEGDRSPKKSKRIFVFANASLQLPSPGQVINGITTSIHKITNTGYTKFSKLSGTGVKAAHDVLTAASGLASSTLGYLTG